MIKEREKPFTEEEIRRFMKQVLQGLSHMHKKRFFHRDLKPGKAYNSFSKFLMVHCCVYISGSICQNSHMDLDLIGMFSSMQKICWWQMMFLKLLILDWPEKYHQCLHILNMFPHDGELYSLMPSLLVCLFFTRLHEFLYGQLWMQHPRFYTVCKYMLF